MLERIDRVEELTLIKKDSLGKVTCFVIFKEPYILNRIEMKSLPLINWDANLTFSQALSYKQLNQKKRPEGAFRAQYHEVRRPHNMHQGRDYQGHQGHSSRRDTSQIEEREWRKPYGGPRDRRSYRGETRKGKNEKRTNQNLDQFIRYNIRIQSREDIATKNIFVGETSMSVDDFLAHYDKSENKRFLGVKYKEQSPKSNSGKYETSWPREIEHGQASLIREIDLKSGHNQSIQSQSYQPFDMKQDVHPWTAAREFSQYDQGRIQESHRGQVSAVIGNEFGVGYQESLFKRSPHPQSSYNW